MSWSHPYLLFFTPFLLVLLYILWRKTSQTREENLAKLAYLHQTAAVTSSNRQLVLRLNFLGVGLCLIALAGPLYGLKTHKVERQGIDILYAVDASNSMLATDFNPSRLGAATRLLQQLVTSESQHRQGLIGYAGAPILLCPLTNDSGTVQLTFEQLHPSMFPVQGTGIGTAIELAIETFNNSQSSSKVLILLTDGEDHGTQPLAAAQKAQEAGIRILTIGMGTPEPTPITINGRPLTDERGNTVFSKLEEDLLIDIAEKTQGYYQRYEPQKNPIEDLEDYVSQLTQDTLRSSLEEQLENRYQWPLVIGLLFLGLAYWLRRRPLNG